MFTTCVTPVTLEASCSAFTFSAVFFTSPFSVTTPLLVSTLIFIALRSGAVISAVLTLAVRLASPVAVTAVSTPRSAAWPARSAVASMLLGVVVLVLAVVASVPVVPVTPVVVSVVGAVVAGAVLGAVSVVVMPLLAVLLATVSSWRLQAVSRVRAAAEASSARRWRVLSCMGLTPVALRFGAMDKL